MAREQLNLRLPPEWFDTLNAEATIGDLTIAEYVKAVVADKVAELEKDPDVQAVQLALQAARARRAAESQPDDNVTPLRQHPRDKSA
jgi:hypothetical protein